MDIAILVSIILSRWIVIYLAAIVQTLESAIHRIKIYPMDSAIGFPITYPLDSAIQRLNNRGLVDNTIQHLNNHSLGQ